jgi:hypothetical protein
VTQLNNLLSDINEDFFQIEKIKRRFEKWKVLSDASYLSAHVIRSLPEIFSPLIRLEILTWDPLDSLEVTQLLFKYYTKKIKFRFFTLAKIC